MLVFSLIEARHQHSYFKQLINIPCAFVIEGTSVFLELEGVTLHCMFYLHMHTKGARRVKFDGGLSDGFQLWLLSTASVALTPLKAYPPHTQPPQMHHCSLKINQRAF